MEEEKEGLLAAATEALRNCGLGGRGGDNARVSPVANPLDDDGKGVF